MWGTVICVIGHQMSHRRPLRLSIKSVGRVGSKSDSKAVCRRQKATPANSGLLVVCAQCHPHMFFTTSHDMFLKQASKHVQHTDPVQCLNRDAGNNYSWNRKLYNCNIRSSRFHSACHRHSDGVKIVTQLIPLKAKKVTTFINLGKLAKFRKPQSSPLWRLSCYLHL
jgi:hypothetical protein